jgi:protein gp37
MAEQTGIEWADATWNPWMGCKKVSTGCKNCYMFRDMAFYGKDPNIVTRAAESSFRNPLKWSKSGKVREGGRIFTCSWSDWFIDSADLWRNDAWAIIRATPKFNYLILTKRPERILYCLPKDWNDGYKNVWLLVSAENQTEYDNRWQILSDIPAHIKGISAEPLLTPLGIATVGSRPDWIITGGESDKEKPRLSEIDWFRDIRDQCKSANIPYFHKQHGGTKKINGAWGGRELDGKTFNEYPNEAQQ